MARPLATVFGGTGFLGRRVVRHLAEQGFAVRAASRHPGHDPPQAGDGAVEPVRADVADDRSVAAALAGARAVVNAVSLYVEHGRATFRSIHVDAAARVAREAQRAGVATLVHLSGIGADPASRSPYIRSRGEGERAVRAAFPEAILIRPAAMVGPDDALLVPLARMLRRAPVFPLFGRGRTRLQPAHVEDVAAAIVRAMAGQGGVTYELGGGAVYEYREMIELVARHVGRRPLLVPVPFPAWQALALVAEQLPHPPIARTQVELMEQDNVADPDMPGFPALDLTPSSVRQVLPLILPSG
ncbi:complex I NDUFA9 subunit family protein [Inquilinus sp. Marseille-Q2685]|uniref:complex I NDUFA9 subunit family protein n=1 Tax=Inquilinus sp. Marseille-Q2685 TaxID=2866581 RepID=UPI001CE4A9D8|nr:complex I NDUFA9 subunit family protein [Inquilinus sp. Marseille-Q2685]